MESAGIIAGLVLSVVCAPVPVPLADNEDLRLAKQFMSRFGYLELGVSGAESLVNIDEALIDVQRFGNIPQTGKLDNSTIQLMKSKRCGLPDSVSKRIKRYVLSQSMGWNKKHLTYFIANWSPKIGHHAIRSEFKEALRAWADYGHLTFQEVFSSSADMIISFGAGYHGDLYPFDGPGSTLAHAFSPNDYDSLAGDIHFDEDETWKVNPGPLEQGVDFFSVAVHEIGHSLGLWHSDVSGSIMNPYYRQFDRNNFNIGYDDLLGMYELYIRRPIYDSKNDQDDRHRPISTLQPGTTTRKMRTTSTTERLTFVGDDESVETHKGHDETHRIPKPKTNDTIIISELIPCDGNYDAVSNLRRELFIFKDQNVWRLSGPGKPMPGYPVPFQRMFRNLPSHLNKIDAAYERITDSNLIFFSGDKYWEHNGVEIEYGSPKSIYDYGLPHYLKKVDAVMVFPSNKKTYIFSGDRYWRFDESTHSMDAGYPQTINKFRGVPSNLDAAMTWTDGITYFFKNNSYWAFNSTWKKTESTYPKPASETWLACS